MSKRKRTFSPEYREQWREYRAGRGTDSNGNYRTRGSDTGRAEDRNNTERQQQSRLAGNASDSERGTASADRHSDDTYAQTGEHRSASEELGGHGETRTDSGSRGYQHWKDRGDTAPRSGDRRPGKRLDDAGRETGNKTKTSDEAAFSLSEDLVTEIIVASGEGLMQAVPVRLPNGKVVLYEGWTIPEAQARKIAVPFIRISQKYPQAQLFLDKYADPIALAWATGAILITRVIGYMGFKQIVFADYNQQWTEHPMNKPRQDQQQRTAQAEQTRGAQSFEEPKVDLDLLNRINNENS